MPQNPVQRLAVVVDHGVEGLFRSPVKAALLATLCLWRKSFAHITGVSVKDTTAETRIVTLNVTANSRNSRPTISPMNKSGMSTAISETVSDKIVKPICAEPLSAASKR